MFCMKLDKIITEFFVHQVINGKKLILFAIMVLKYSFGLIKRTRTYAATERVSLQNLVGGSGITDMWSSLML